MQTNEQQANGPQKLETPNTEGLLLHWIVSNWGNPQYPLPEMITSLQSYAALNNPHILVVSSLKERIAIIEKNNLTLATERDDWHNKADNMRSQRHHWEGEHLKVKRELEDIKEKDHSGYYQILTRQLNEKIESLTAERNEVGNKASNLWEIKKTQEKEILLLKDQLADTRKASGNLFDACQGHKREIDQLNNLIATYNNGAYETYWGQKFTRVMKHKDDVIAKLKKDIQHWKDKVEAMLPKPGTDAVDGGKVVAPTGQNNAESLWNPLRSWVIPTRLGKTATAAASVVHAMKSFVAAGDAFAESIKKNIPDGVLPWVGPENKWHEKRVNPFLAPAPTIEERYNQAIKALSELLQEKEISLHRSQEIIKKLTFDKEEYKVQLKEHSSALITERLEKERLQHIVNINLPFGILSSVVIRKGEDQDTIQELKKQIEQLKAPSFINDLWTANQMNATLRAKNTNLEAQLADITNKYAQCSPDRIFALECKITGLEGEKLRWERLYASLTPEAVLNLEKYQKVCIDLDTWKALGEEAAKTIEALRKEIVSWKDNDERLINTLRVTREERDTIQSAWTSSCSSGISWNRPWPINVMNLLP